VYVIKEVQASRAPQVTRLGNPQRWIKHLDSFYKSGYARGVRGDEMGVRWKTQGTQISISAGQNKKHKTPSLRCFLLQVVTSALVGLPSGSASKPGLRIGSR
jgi:hypothetical protein